MRGSIRQRSEGSWELRVFTGREPLTGRRQYVTQTVRGSKREAESELAKLVAGAGRRGPTASLSVGEVLERWYEHAVPGLSPSTAKIARVILDAHLLPHVGAIPLSKLTTAKVDAVYRLLADKGGRGGKPLAAGTVRRAHSVLHRALEQAVRWDWMAVNPASRATLPRLRPPAIRPPTPKEIQLLLEEANRLDPALGLYIHLAAATGARRGELLGLRWADVRPAEGVLLISRSLVVGTAGVTEKGTKTHSARRIALDARTVELLGDRRTAAEQAALACEVSLGSDAFIFSNDPDGARGWRPEYATQAFARIADRAGLAQVRLHDLRHFVATRLLANGIDVRTVAGRLGHRNPNVTLNVYAHFLPEADRGAADLLGSLLEPTSTAE